MTKDKALRMALRWITDVSTNNEDEVIQACKDALAQPTTEQSSLVQEPVAWMNDIAFSMDKELLGTRSRIVPLYTTPPSREWQSLSDVEIIYMYNEPSSDAEMIEFARAIEAKLREKNELS